MRIVALVGIGLLLVAGGVLGQLPPVHGGKWTFQLPKFTEPPTLDGVKGAEEWANALGPFECSPSQVKRDMAEFGQASDMSSNVSTDQTGCWGGDETVPAEDPNICMTDLDKTSWTWMAWDDDALYAFHENLDNVRDPDNATGDPTHWWGRDSVSIYIDLTNANEDHASGAPYVSLNIVNFLAAPIGSNAVAVTWERTEAGARATTQDPALTGAFYYGFRDAGQEFGGEQDYAIEAAYPWEGFMMVNLPATPVVGTMMGWSWLYVDPDGDPDYGGQLQCWGNADFPLTFSDYVFSGSLAGPGSGTAVQADSWGAIKATFSR